MLAREQQPLIERMLGLQPAVCLLGPRQAGKTTLARAIADTRNSVYLDLESVTDSAKLADPHAFFAAVPEALIVLDEIQRVPQLFPSLRGIIDEDRRQGRSSGRFLILGSASFDLLQQASESLAGRIAYIELGPFSALEIEKAKGGLNQLWLRGGFPRSFMADDDVESLIWRQDFIRSYLERDIPQFGPRIPAETLRRFWTMLAHTQGQPFNAARLAGSLGISGVTAGRYLDLMVDLLLVRKVSPWISNVGKRLVRSPKVYVRDCGLVHALLNIASLEQLLGHPVAGASWEGLVVENILAHIPFPGDAGFYRTAAGAEIDLIVSLPPDELWAIEIKRSLAPKLERGFHHACEDLQPTRRIVVYPGSASFPLDKNTLVMGLEELLDDLKTKSN